MICRKHQYLASLCHAVKIEVFCLISDGIGGGGGGLVWSISIREEGEKVAGAGRFVVDS